MNMKETLDQTKDIMPLIHYGQLKQGNVCLGHIVEVIIAVMVSIKLGSIKFWVAAVQQRFVKGFCCFFRRVAIICDLSCKQLHSNYRIYIVDDLLEKIIVYQQ